jgi:hypothetical protein
LTGVVATAKLEAVFLMIEQGSIAAADADRRLKDVIKGMYSAMEQQWKIVGGAVQRGGA